MNPAAPQRTSWLSDINWIVPTVLLLFLSIVPFLIPMGEAVPEIPGPSAQRIIARPHNRVVVFIIDGLGYRKALESGWMPHLKSKLKIGAGAVGLASFPTITPSGLRAIFSGRQIGGQPQMPTGMNTSAEVDSVMSRAATAGLKCYAFGQFSWPPLFPNGHGAHLTVIPFDGLAIKYEHGPTDTMNHYDDHELQAAEAVINGNHGKWDLLILHLFESDPIAHSIGTENILYQKHLLWLDQRIEDISRRLQQSEKTAILVLADHGQAQDGSHGGLTSVERRVPFVMWGSGIRTINLGTIPLYDAAPTLTALLGIPPPITAEGWPLIDAMALTPKQKADIMVDLLHQRLRRWAGIRAARPWLIADPSAETRGIKRMYNEGRYANAAAGTERFIHITDETIKNALPEKWMWRLVAALWCLVAATSFVVAWAAPLARSSGPIAVLAVASIALLILPVIRPISWSWASSGVLISAAGLMALSIISCVNRFSGMGRFGWIVWWISVLGISSQEFMDLSLWSWWVVFSLFLSRAIQITKDNLLTLLVSLVGVLACGLLISGTASIDSSIVRSLIIPSPWTATAHLPWGAVEMAIGAFVVIAGYLSFGLAESDEHSLLRFFTAIGPLILASLFMQWRPSLGAWSWLACFIPLAVMVCLPMSPTVRGMWLSAVLLAYYRTLSDDRQWCLLALAVVTGWGLAWNSRDGHPLWEGLALFGLGLWSFKLTGGSVTFSHISVAEGERLLGEGWHPLVLLVLLTIKQLTAIAAPILPFLYSRPLRSLMAILPLMGALSAGNLSSLWWDHFVKGNTQRITDDIEYTRTVFIVFMMWALFILWMAIRVSDRLAGFFQNRLNAIKRRAETRRLKIAT